MRIAALTLLLGTASVSAAEKEEADMFTASEIASEMRGAEAANLDAALLRAGKEAVIGAENMAALLRSSSRTARAALAEIKTAARGRPLSEEADELSLSAGMLEARSSEFLAKAASASLRLGELEDDELLARRAGYRSKDRERDAARAADTLAKAGLRHKRKGAGDLGPAETDLLACVDAALTEMAALRELFKSHPAELETRAKGAVSRREVLEVDIEDLTLEKRLLETALKLRRYDEEAFNGDSDEVKGGR